VAKTPRALANTVYAASTIDSRDFGLRDQMRRTSVSILANIAEGFGRSGSVEFQQYPAMAKGSSCEVMSHP
jgi:four helix bundle protein